jgi:hypothetical protein
MDMSAGHFMADILHFFPGVAKSSGSANPLVRDRTGAGDAGSDGAPAEWRTLTKLPVL